MWRNHERPADTSSGSVAMIILSAIGVLLIAAGAATPTLMLRKRGLTTWWDCVYPFTGAIAWFLLSMTRIGSTITLSNFVVEVFWIAVASVTIPWARWFLSRSQNEQRRALLLVMTFLPIVLALAIRLFTPSLPE